MKTKIIWWRFSALMLCWALLAVLLTVIRITSSTIDRATFGCLILVSANWLITTTIAFKPLTKGSV